MSRARKECEIRNERKKLIWKFKFFGIIQMKSFTNQVELAMREADKSPHLHQHGCVAMNFRGKVLAVGFNHVHPRKCREKGLRKR